MKVNFSTLVTVTLSSAWALKRAVCTADENARFTVAGACHTVEREGWVDALNACLIN